MRIVLDTNVLVAGFLNAHGHAARILRLVIQGDIEIVADQKILGEYSEVLARPKFKLPQDEIAVVIELLRLRCINPPAMAQKISLPDKDDEPFAEAAVSGMADCIVTGDKRHFPQDRCKGVKILKPADFVRLMEEGKIQASR